MSYVSTYGAVTQVLWDPCNGLLRGLKRASRAQRDTTFSPARSTSAILPYQAPCYLQSQSISWALHTSSLGTPTRIPWPFPPHGRKLGLSSEFCESGPPRQSVGPRLRVIKVFVSANDDFVKECLTWTPTAPQYEETRGRPGRSSVSAYKALTQVLQRSVVYACPQAPIRGNQHVNQIDTCPCVR